MPGEEWSDREIDPGASIDREVDRLRSVYRDHAETLSRLAATAPSKQLAHRYQELIGEVNKAIVGLDDVEPRPPLRADSARPSPPEAAPQPPQQPPARPPEAHPAADRHPEPLDRPILSSYTASAPAGGEDDGTVLRVALIIGLAIVLLCVLALFVWKFSGEVPAEPSNEAAAGAKPAQPIVPAQPPEEKEEEAKPVTPPPPSKPATPLSVTPRQQDFGNVAKGSSAVRTFEVRNASKSAMTLEISRSKCRCLWYDPPKSLPPGGRGTLTVRLDGTRAPAGSLAESIEVSAKGQPGAVAVVEITADVK